MLKFIKFLSAILLIGLAVILQADAAQKTISFSGYTWNVKGSVSDTDRMGPGNNLWNDGSDSVFVDGSGKLHLKVKQKNGNWYSSEVYLGSSLGYGKYSWTIDSGAKNVDTNLVVGLFMYQDDTHELDIEFSDWQYAGGWDYHYSVQPYYISGNSKSAFFPFSAEPASYVIDWQPNQIVFYGEQNGKQSEKWIYTGSNNFVPGKEFTDINFWMINATPPSDKKEHELIVSKFVFTPFNQGGSSSSSSSGGSSSSSSSSSSSTSSSGGSGNGSSSSSTSSGGAGSIWKPALKTTWDIQFQAPINKNINVQAVFLDLFDTSSATVTEFHQKGTKTVCYINVGAWEDWRSDKGQFPSSVLGKDYAGWAGEKWLDIRQINTLAPIMRARLDLCKSKGFDGVDPDNLDGYQNDTGFPLTANDQLAYNKWLADEAHKRGLSIGLKNDGSQVNSLVSYFDWAIVESCYKYNECSLYTPFTVAGKPVFMIEYSDYGITTNDFCPTANQYNFNGLLKKLDLGSFRQECPTGSSSGSSSSSSSTSSGGGSSSSSSSGSSSSSSGGSSSGSTSSGGSSSGSSASSGGSGSSSSTSSGGSGSSSTSSGSSSSSSSSSGGSSSSSTGSGSSSSSTSSSGSSSSSGSGSSSSSTSSGGSSSSSTSSGGSSSSSSASSGGPVNSPSSGGGGGFSPSFHYYFDVNSNAFTSHPFSIKESQNSTPAIPQMFSDVGASHPNYEAIKYVKENGIALGYADNTFKPSFAINRAEFTKIIIGAKFDKSVIDKCIQNSFSDVQWGAWYAKYTCVAKSNNIVSGYQDGRFNPSKTVNFAEAAKIIVNTFGYSVSSDSIWYKPYIGILRSKNAIPVTIQKADQNITRGEMAEMVWRMMKAN